MRIIKIFFLIYIIKFSFIQFVWMLYACISLYKIGNTDSRRNPIHSTKGRYMKFAIFLNWLAASMCVIKVIRLHIFISSQYLSWRPYDKDDYNE